MRTVKIGTRGSQLALYQADFVLNLLQKYFPDKHFERVIIKTQGDRDQLSSLTKIGGIGIFTKTIEESLLKNAIDIAVHSLKDLPSQMDSALTLAAVPERGPVEDILITPDGIKLNELGSNASVATGSIRRRSQILNLRPDLQIKDLRGNIKTRLRKLNEQNLDGIIMAKAAIVRLALEEVKYTVFPVNEIIPAVGQGAIGIQIRKADREISEMLKPLNHTETFLSVAAERAFLKRLDSGCQFPVGAIARVKADRLHLRGVIGSEDGVTIMRKEITGDARHAEKLGNELAEQFLTDGAEEILGAVSR
jgi:hydroxymethylbilane synthase